MRHFVRALVAIAALTAVLPLGELAPVGAQAGLERVGEFRPFPRKNKLGTSQYVSIVDTARRRWFFVTPGDPVTGDTTRPQIWLFDLDGLQQVGGGLRLTAAPSFPLASALDAARGHLVYAYGPAGAPRIAVIGAAGGPHLVREWVATTALKGGNGAYDLGVRGLSVVGDKAYVLAAAPNFVPQGETFVLQLDVPKLMAGQDPLDWKYRFNKCGGPATLRGPAPVGVSRREPIVTVGCRAPTTGSELQGVALLDLGSFAPQSTAGFRESFYPIAGDYGTADTYFDPVTDRIGMRRTGPAQLVLFDARSRRWMRPVVFGQNNMYQTGLDLATGRLYGFGNDPSAGASRQNLYVPEVRPTPPQNGLVQEFRRPTGEQTAAVAGVMAVDSPTQRVFVADVDTFKNAAGSTVEDGLYFHIYRDPRPPLAEIEVSDPDEEIINLSGEAQGYGARVSYIGGFGGTFTNTFGGFPYPGGDAAAPGSRHLTFARTVRLRLTEGEASAEATVSHPEGATAAEFTEANQPWPYQPVSCRDFGNAPSKTRDASGDAEVECDVEHPVASTVAVYEAENDDPREAPVQRAFTTATITIHRTKGVVTAVTSEGSLDIPGIVSIGRMTATATTAAAGKKGTAASTYERDLRDVTIGGQPYCQADCDPDDVAREINTRFATASSTGMLVVAEAPKPDPALRASPGGVQAILQRDRWAHEEDLAIHDGSEDRYEHPAFVIALYQDRRYPQHEVYSLAAVQAVSRLPKALADDIDDLAAPDDGPTPSFANPDSGGGFPTSIDDLDLPIGPAGSSLSRPLRERPIGNRRPRLGLFEEQLAWTLASPFRSPPMLAVFAFLAVPVYLSSRRRLLLSHRPAEAGDLHGR